ncbi:hypothetical protein NP493_5945g00003 [Ridgeia piscesae]|uniref:Uncharacterized protein n=1 Tax=Ridgeia piscesae TaxID=27915 RepID=A0AAD9IT95_RIDPI|nr:hypothetical protein NP493_5945g00003 [Ridgeia piscesae]
MRPGRPPGAGSVSRRRRPNARDGGGSADVCVYLLTSSFCLRGISFVYGGSVVSPTKKIHNFVYGGSVVRKVAQEKRAGPARPSGAMRPGGGRPAPGRCAGGVGRTRETGEAAPMFASTYLQVAWTAGKTGRNGAAVGCDAARPAARRRVGEPAASAERERRGRQRRCLRLLTYKFFLSTGDQFRLRGISCFADQENTQVAQEKRAGPARPSGAMRPGSWPPGAGSVSRRRRPNARAGGGSADIRKFLFSPCLASDGCRILAARIRVRRGTRYGMGLRRRSVGGGALLNERSRGTSRTRESRYRPDGLASSASGRRIRTACGKTAERSSSTSWRACESVRGFEGRRPPAD